MKLIFFLFFVLLSIQSTCFARNIETSSVKSLSLGNTLPKNTHAELPTSVFFQDCMSLNINQTGQYLHSELQSTNIEAGWRKGRFRGAGLLHTFGYRHYRMFGAAISSATKIHPDALIGVSLHYQQLKYTGMDSSPVTLSTSLAFSYDLSNRYLLYSNLHIPLINNSAHFNVYDEATLGCLFRFSQTSEWTIETSLENKRNVVVKTSYEYMVNAFSLRFGVFGTPIVPTFGFGYQWQSISMNLSDQWHLALGHTLSIGLSYELKK